MRERGRPVVGMSAWTVVFACTAMAASPRSFARPDWTTTYLHPPSAYTSISFAASGNAQGGWAEIGGFERPVLWNSSAASMQVLLPQTGGWYGGHVLGMSGNRQVGWLGNQDGRLHAAMWLGSRDSFVDLNPALVQYDGSQANAIRGSQAVGYAHYYFGNQSDIHAAVWDVDRGSFRDIHPLSGSSWSQLYATDGEYQGGRANRGVRAGGYAALWHGTAESFVDLSPSFATQSSMVTGMAPGVQVGQVVTAAGRTQAALWHGTAASYQNLTPSGALDAEIYATTGTIHVGGLLINGRGWDPCVWMNDSPSSCINLRPYLAPGRGDTVALSVSVLGDRIYVSGAGGGLNGTVEALLWVGTIPTPGTALVLGFGLLVGGRRARRRGR